VGLAVGVGAGLAGRAPRQSSLLVTRSKIESPKSGRSILRFVGGGGGGWGFLVGWGRGFLVALGVGGLGRGFFVALGVGGLGRGFFVALGVGGLGRGFLVGFGVGGFGLGVGRGVGAGLVVGGFGGLRVGAAFGCAPRKRTLRSSGRFGCVA
jgi:hypothetical protein